MHPIRWNVSNHSIQKFYISQTTEYVMAEKQIGTVSDYFAKISVAAVKLSGALKVGQEISIKGATTDFKQKVDSIQIEGKKVVEAKKGDHIGIKVKDRVRPNDKIFLE